MKWYPVAIAQICVKTEQRDPTLSPDIPFHYIDISAIDKDAKRIVAAPEVMGADAPSRARKAVRSGDVLVSTVRPNLNAVAIVPPELDGQIASTGFCVLRANSALAEAKFIFFRCMTPDFVNGLVSHMRGANYPAVSDEMVKRHKTLLPPLREQRRIVELLEQADELRRQRAEADKLADRILPALFLKMFGDPAANPKRWTREKLGLLLDGIESGWSPVCENRQVRPNEWGILKLGAVTTNRYLDRENKALPDDEEPQPELEVKPGDLLFSRKNTRELVGACVYVRMTRPKLMLSDLIFRLRLKTDAEVNPLYLWALLTNPGKRPAIEALAGGSAGSMPNISKSRLECMEVEKPPKSLQDQFAHSVVELDSLRGNMGTVHENLESLFSVVLHRAFTGELTAKWREAHLKELLAEMEQQARLLKVSPDSDAD
ncbi:MAG: hypothetical protein FJ398_04090 [Verrucomicrobia bacterium]|nr:hypothetical protein [Verrucomicrobiota bacterium]